jgi:alkylation response protein AidB-like acyl-CoA dehydrogenase
VNFGLSEEQGLLDETVRRFLAERTPISRLRELRDDESVYDDGVWKEFAALGVAGCLIDEAYGGSGLGVLDAAVIATALGHGAAPLPFLSSAVMAPLLLGALGSEEQRRQWLPGLAAGELRVSVAASELVERRQDAGVEMAAGKLTGTTLFVPDAPGAAAYLIPTGDNLWLVPADATGLEARALPTIDASRGLAEMRLAQCEGERVGPAGGAGAALARTLDVARVVLAADALGWCDRALVLAVAYAQERKQFDRPIASFQAVKHLCAEMAAAIEPARSLLWYAAHGFDAEGSLPEEPSVLAALAKSHLSDVATFVLRTATEVHGGIGFTDECDLHFWFHRVALDRQLLGGPEKLRGHAAALQGWGS